MDKQERKIIAPVIITVTLVAYYCVFILVCILIPMPWWAKLLGILIPLAAASLILYVLLERIKEIRSGEEDDLDNY